MNIGPQEWLRSLKWVDNREGAALDSKDVEALAQKRIDTDPKIIHDASSLPSLYRLKLSGTSTERTHCITMSQGCFHLTPHTSSPEVFSNQLANIYDGAAIGLLKALSQNDNPINAPTIPYKRLRCWIVRSDKWEGQWELYISICIPRRLVDNLHMLIS